MKTANRLMQRPRFLSMFLGVLTFITTLGLTGLSSSAEAAGWKTFNRYWKGYWYDNGDWYFLYNDGRVSGVGSYRKIGNVWSYFYGYSTTTSYLRQPGQWDYQHTIYGTPGPKIYPTK